MTVQHTNGHLRAILEDACETEECSLRDLTVLAAQNDPFRQDTPANHRDGEWLAIQAEQLGLGDRVIHLRGLHYMMRPAGNQAEWQAIHQQRRRLAVAIRKSREGGPVARLHPVRPDQRSAQRRADHPGVQPPRAKSIHQCRRRGRDPRAEIVPRAEVADFRGTQPFKLVCFGEKSSLEPILAPSCERRHADLYLPTGEIVRHADLPDSERRRPGRPADGGADFSDWDPSGWQMPISIARKLQAFKASLFRGP